MSRDLHPRYVPFCETRIAMVDQYSFDSKDSAERVCHNGISRPFYSCDGKINRTLPLDKYPKTNEFAPEVRLPLPPHFEARSQRLRNSIMSGNFQQPIREGYQDIQEGRVEGLYFY
jgi:hypothetical protein